MKLTTRTLGEICDEVKGTIRTGPFGSQLHKSDYKDAGLPVVMPKNIIDGQISTEDIVFIDDNDAERLSQHRLKKGDIVYGRRGDIGRRALIKDRESSWLCGTGCLRISLGNRILNPDFLYYYLGDLQVIAFIYNQAVGATMPNLNTTIIRNIPITYPSLITQNKIASVLSAYDDLIENNTRRIKVLETMAQTLYQEWFVKFRFPGKEQVKMVESELGLIPEGWEVVQIKDFGKVITGKTPSKKKPEYYGDYMPFIKTPSMHGKTFCIEVEEYLSEFGVSSQKNKIIPPHSLCVSCIGTAGIVNITTSFSQTNQQINSIILDNQENLEFLYFALLNLKETINQYGSNGATMVNLNKGKFEALKALLPQQNILSEFHRITKHKFDLIRNLQIRNINLRKTRDLLLPKLISGQIDVETLDIDTGELAA